jgi:hypothetical protein
LRATVKRMGERTAEKWAAEKAAFAAGKVIQSRYEKFLCNWSDWQDELYPEWLNEPTIEYRIKPWSLTRSLPGFRPLEDGEEWHRVDGWKEEWLSDGWRPLLKGEDEQVGDEYRFQGDRKPWRKCETQWMCSKAASFECDCHRRTRRPLPALPDPQRELVPLEAAPWTFETAPRDRMVWVVKNGETSERLVVQWRAFDTIISGGQPNYSELLRDYKQRDGKPCGEARS